MSDKHRSLASYFDEPDDARYSWHDQTEPLQAPPSPGQGLGGHDVKALGKWMFVPGQADMLWVPEGYHWSDRNQAPAGTTFHYRKQKEWSASDWGYQEYRRIQDQANMKTSEGTKAPKQKMTPEQRKEWKAENAAARQETRTERSASVRQYHEKAFQTLDTLAQTLTETNPLYKIHSILGGVNALLASAKLESKEKRTQLARTEGKTNKERKILLHGHTSDYITDARWTVSDGVLAEIDEYCKDNSIINTLGTKLPEPNPDSKRFLSVEILFLSKAKEVIMSAILHVMANKAKAGRASDLECDYVNASYAANNILSKMHGKDRYMRRPDAKLPDSKQIEICKTMIMQLEQKRFKTLHSNKALPKHLQWAPPHGDRKNDKQGHHKGAGHSHIKPGEFEAFKAYMAFKNKQHAHPHNSHPHHKKERTSPPSAPPARRGRGGGLPAPSQSPAQAYMHGYYY